MKFVSTRGVESATFEEALFCCYAKDGGLLMPEKVIKVSLSTLSKWKKLCYVDVVKEIVALFVSPEEIPLEDQREILDKAFKKFDTEEVVEIARLKNGLNVLELWHGDTLAFKDLGMACTIGFIEYFLRKRNRRFTPVVVTSGDTGSSSMYAARDVKGLNLIVLYPHNRISKLQEIMMTTLQADNIHLYAVNGSSDDIDLVTTRILTDNQYVGKHKLGTMNSMNWGRIMIQIAHHVYGYLQIAEKIGQPVNIIIPCGGCGNIAACMLACEMGIPLNPIAVCNKNDSFDQMLRSNERTLVDVDVSKAPAMDISYALNIERIVWLFAGKNGDLVNQIMTEFVNTKKSRLPNDLYQKISGSIRSSVASDDVIIEAIKRCWEENKYHICPHTATAVAHFYGTTKGYVKPTDDNPTFCVATASAAKFVEALDEANVPKCDSKKIETLQGLPERAIYIPSLDGLEEILRKKIETISRD